MKNKLTFILIAILIGISAFPLGSLAEIPQKVTVQKINIYGNSSDFGEATDGVLNIEVKNGKVIIPEEMYAGQRQAKVVGIEYNLDFWNVGEEGGKEGMLFWKKDYGLATLTFNYNFDGPGYVVKKGQEFEGLKSFQFEDATREPSAQVVYNLKFSGGPNGFFEELPPYVSKAGPAKGNVINGNLVSFDFPHDEKTSYPYAIYPQWLGFPWEISGDPFYGYDTGGDPCGFDAQFSNNNKQEFSLMLTAKAKDSGARFTAFSGEVTVAPEYDLEDEEMADLEMVLAEGDHIQTQIESCAIIGFSDMTTFIMNPLTSIILEHSPPKQSHLSILAGKIWANVKKMTKDGTMDIKMNQAVAGIKGTTFVLEETGTESIIKVIEGEVAFTSLADNSKVMVGSGETVTATSAGLSGKTNFDVETETQAARQIEDKLASGRSTTNSTPSSAKKSSVPIILVVVVVLLSGVYFFFRTRKKSRNSGLI